MSDANLFSTRFHNAQLIVFDWDGTLFDSTAAIAHSLSRAAYELNLGSVSEQQARQVIGLGFAEAAHALLGALSPSALNAFAAKYRQHYFIDEERLTLFDGILPMLQQLRAQRKHLAVATGKSRAGLKRLLDKHPELAQLFSSTRTADQTASKPHPLMLHEILAEHQLSAAQAVMVGDTRFDIEMAHAAQMPCIAVTYGAHALSDLQTSQPEAMAHNVAQLVRLLSIQVGE